MLDLQCQSQSAGVQDVYYLISQLKDLDLNVSEDSPSSVFYAVRGVVAVRDISTDLFSRFLQIPSDTFSGHVGRTLPREYGCTRCWHIRRTDR